MESTQGCGQQCYFAMTTTTTIQEAVQPFFTMCFIIGLGVYPLKESRLKIKWIIYLSILYSLIIWSIHLYFLYNIISFHLLHRTNMVKIVMKINIIIAIASAILNVYYYKKFQVFMKKLAAVDDTLEKLGTSKVFQKMHMWSKGMVIVWIIYSLALNFYTTLWLVNRGETSSWIYILPHLGNYCLHVNVLMDLIFITFLWHLHLELCRITRGLNGMFGTQMTFKMASYLLHLTLQCHYLYGILTQKVQEEAQMTAWIGLFLWIFIFVSRLCIINYFCEKANKIGKIICQLTSSLRYANIRKEIYQFTLQIMHHPLRFTGMGLFYFGNNFLRKFCMKIVTFVIIILQTSGN